MKRLAFLVFLLPTVAAAQPASQQKPDPVSIAIQAELDDVNHQKFMYRVQLTQANVALQEAHEKIAALEKQIADAKPAATPAKP